MNNTYLTPISFYDDAKKRYDELYEISQEIKKRLAKYPKGKIHIKNKNGNIQYYLRLKPNEKTGTYISKKDDKKIKLYLQKKYDEDVITLINQEMKMLDEYLTISTLNKSLIQQLYSDNPAEIKSKLIPVDVSNEDYILEWQSEPYERKPIGDDVPIFITNKGERVRSKSELTIANALERMGIPYKYECPVKLFNGQIIYPDFTVLNVLQRKQKYWEHRGIMDDENYARHSVHRIKQLGRTNIQIGDNLIVTEEAVGSPLGTDEIDRIIELFL